MNRRAFVFASLAACAGLAAVRAASALKVVYIGGWDCGACTTWKNQHLANWVAAPEYQRVVWVEIDPPRLKEAYQEQHWPAELRPILAQLPRKSGTPRFLIVKDGKVVWNESGVSKWQDALIEVRKLLGQ